MASSQSSLHKAFHIDAGAHGDLTGTKLDPNVNLEVIGLGLSRTGTTSLQAALTRLGYAPSHQGVDLFRSVRRTEAFIDIFNKVLAGVWKAGDPVLSNRLRELMRGYRSCTDNPIYLLADEIYPAYPDAKYILTVRPDGAQGWFGSMEPTMWHFRSDWWRTWFRFCIYPVTFLRRTDEKARTMGKMWIKKFGSVGPQVYNGHNDEVKALIPKEQLLVYDVREGWEPLCKFLQVPVPDEPFPRLNDSQAMKSIYFGMMTFGLFNWAIYSAVVASLGYLARYPEVARSLAQRTMEIAGNNLGTRLGL